MNVKRFIAASVVIYVVYVTLTSVIHVIVL